jgi:hypothetical protein
MKQNNNPVFFLNVTFQEFVLNAHFCSQQVNTIYKDDTLDSNIEVVTSNIILMDRSDVSIY